MSPSALKRFELMFVVPPLVSQFSHRPVAMADHLLRVALSLCHLRRGQDNSAAIEVLGRWGGDGGQIKGSLNASQRLCPFKDNLKVIEQAGINCRTMLHVSLGRC